MLAATRSKYGPPDLLTIQEVEKPTPRDNEVLVKVFAATVSRTDCGILWGRPFVLRLITGFPNPRNKVIGTDFAGLVEAVGKKVTSFKAGDRVWGFDDSGLSSHAEYLSFREDKTTDFIPGNISYQQAAASAEGAHYAINFINKIDLKPGQKVLVNGATGAIGSAAVQLLKHFGAEVTAVCNAKDFDAVRSLGADRLIDYTTQDFTQDEHRYHYVLDAVGKSSFGKCKPLLLPDGIYISSELGPRWENTYLPLITKITGGKRIIFPFPLNIKASLQLVKSLLENGEFRPLIDRTYPLAKIAEAFRYADSGQKVGNVMITFVDH